MALARSSFLRTNQKAIALGLFFARVRDWIDFRHRLGHIRTLQETGHAGALQMAEPTEPATQLQLGAVQRRARLGRVALGADSAQPHPLPPVWLEGAPKSRML